MNPINKIIKICEYCGYPLNTRIFKNEPGCPRCGHIEILTFKPVK
jgi:predicted RNA-binding Zn-ribbon protein involved in translation (DUF1610 family)